jgi:hypothetical protein
MTVVTAFASGFVVGLLAPSVAFLVFLARHTHALERRT